MRDMRKLTIENDIKLEDMFIGGKVVNRSELCEKLNISLKKLQNIGGYKMVLNYFNLAPPSPYHNENNEKVLKFIEFANEYILKYDRLPLKKECIDNNIFGSQFATNYGGYKKLIEDCGFKYKKSLSYSVVFEKSKEQMINEFKTFYNYEVAPSCVEVDMRYFNGEFYFGKSAIEGKFENYTDFINQCEYSSFLTGRFSQRHLAKDVHVCDSAIEKFIDDFLFDSGINHTSHVMYKKIINGLKTKHKMDWLLKDGTVVEYFGLHGNTKYDRKVDIKLKLLNENNIKYIAIYPKDFDKLDIIFADYLPKEVRDYGNLH